LKVQLPGIIFSPVSPSISIAQCFWLIDTEARDVDKWTHHMFGQFGPPLRPYSISETCERGPRCADCFSRR
jgi:hypothetical protein